MLVKVVGVLKNQELFDAGLGLAMRFPEGWRVRNRSQNVIAASPGGEAFIDLRAGGGRTA
jgi:predicted Zn-dependent protease